MAHWSGEKSLDLLSVPFMKKSTSGLWLISNRSTKLLCWQCYKVPPMPSVQSPSCIFFKEGLKYKTSFGGNKWMTGIKRSVAEATYHSHWSRTAAAAWAGCPAWRDRPAWGRAAAVGWCWESHVRAEQDCYTVQLQMVLLVDSTKKCREETAGHWLLCRAALQEGVATSSS